MAELLERWLEWRPTVRPIAPTTVSSYRAAMDRYILPALGKLPVRQVDAATLDAFYAQLRTRGGKDGRPLKASTVHEVHAVLSGALKQAVVWGWVAHNPAKLATAPSVEKADVQPPQAEDAAAQRAERRSRCRCGAPPTLVLLVGRQGAIPERGRCLWFAQRKRATNAERVTAHPTANTAATPAGATSRNLTSGGSGSGRAAKDTSTSTSGCSRYAA